MNTDQIRGRYFRLQQELAAAYAFVPWNTGHIDRLTNELAHTERELATARADVHATDMPSANSDSPRISSSH